ncbi:MAG TPA: PIN domain-containing protein [Chloroflexota bacterium]|nr:PIN domain-containing protein [Chloroflexota bacterium]
MPEVIDTSVWNRRHGTQLRDWFESAFAARELVVCDMVKLEALQSARNAREFTSLKQELEELPWCRIALPEFGRALEVYETFAQQGGAYQRSVKHPDLLIAAAAESAGLTVVHYDEDYDRIGAVTGQPMRWVAPRGSL